MSDTSSSSSGIGFVGALTITFIVLKLTGVIAWPWLWVLSPMWISFGAAIVLISVSGGVYLLYQTIKKRKHKLRRVDIDDRKAA